MARKRLLWQLYPSYLVITLVSLLVVSLVATQSFRKFYRNQTEENLENLARLVTVHVKAALKMGDYQDVDDRCKALGQEVDARITVILEDGQVVGESDKNPAEMENHLDRPEIISALKTGKGLSSRYSYTKGQPLMYVAVGIEVEGEVAAVARTALPVTAMDKVLADFFRKILLAGILVAIGVAVLSLILSRRISRSIERMKMMAQSYARGEFVAVDESAADDYRTSEIGDLADTLSAMAQQLDERILTITNQRNELEVILSSMVEGVLAVDISGNVLSMNDAAAKYLQVNKEVVQGLSIYEVIRNSSIQHFIEKTLQSDGVTEADIYLPASDDKYLRLQGAILCDAKQQRTGAVIVINDMTQLRRLENMRRDFVANVSHELKTPITSIKGFVETLQDGAMKDETKAQEFLAIILRHTDRLNAIIEDLLSLSRLEETSEKDQITFSRERMHEVLNRAVELTKVKAEHKRIQLEVKCDQAVAARINADLIEQALVNLIDNAIKYSPENENVTIELKKANGQVEITVADQGCGIDPSQLSRIFERFYVVDKARSRKLGGTGLGLAIVKHIIQAHEGTVEVKSRPGEGSIFTLRLPCI